MEQRVFAQARQQHFADGSREKVVFEPGQLVMLHREEVPVSADGKRHAKFLPLWLGAYRVVAMINDNAVEIEGRDGVRRVVSVQRVKRFYPPMGPEPRFGPTATEVERSSLWIRFPSLMTSPMSLLAGFF